MLAFSITKGKWGNRLSQKQDPNMKKGNLLSKSNFLEQ